MSRRLLTGVARIFDALDRAWSAPRARQLSATLFVIVFLTSLAIVELARHGWLPEPVLGAIPKSHFAAVSLVFSLLLFFEIAGLVFSLARSVADSVGKQFELLALILIREAFLEFAHSGEPMDWTGVQASVPHVVADMAGALAVFALLIPYYRVQRHRAITADEVEQANFVRAKKAVSLALLGTFIALTIFTLPPAIRGEQTIPFFPTFYTVLVLSDVLMVLISLRFSSTFYVVFRNAGFAAAAVLVRVALSAPPYINVALAVAATGFALALSYAYNAWAQFDSHTAG